MAGVFCVHLWVISTDHTGDPLASRLQSYIDTVLDAFIASSVTESSPAAAGWQAHLSLACQRSADRTVARRCRHQGPLTIQRALYPEGDGTAHFYLLHPPGGLVQGDRIEIDVSVDAGAQALITTPSAAKLYRTPAGGTYQQATLAVRAQGSLEWLPQEAILFDGASGHVGLTLELAADARVIAWDAWVLGRAAAGERFEQGLYDNRLSVIIDGQLHWQERTRVVGSRDSPMQDAAWGLAGHNVLGTLIAYGGPHVIDNDVVETVRAALIDINGQVGVTRIDDLLVVRILCSDTRVLHRVMHDAWQVLRPRVMSRPVVTPRIWAT